MNDSRSDIRTIFDNIAQSYDLQRRHLIPCFDDFYGTVVSLADLPNEQPVILDIGAGTGLLSAMLLEKYPQAQVVLIDISEAMMAMARKRFGSFSRVEYIVDDFARHRFNRSFDMIVSSLAIHHLNDGEKASLYRMVFDNLKDSGLFINADQVQGSTAHIQNLYMEDWRSKVLASPLTRDELRQAQERTKLDQMSTLEAQLGWLREAGFTDVDCVYKYYNFVVLYARKAIG